MVGARAISQQEVKESNAIRDKIKLIRVTLEEALYAKDSRSKNVPIIRSLRLLIELEKELEKFYRMQ